MKYLRNLQDIENEIELFTNNMLEFDYDEENIRYCERVIIDLEEEKRKYLLTNEN